MRSLSLSRHFHKAVFIPLRIRIDMPVEALQTIRDDLLSDLIQNLLCMGTDVSYDMAKEMAEAQLQSMLNSSTTPPAGSRLLDYAALRAAQHATQANEAHLESLCRSHIQHLNSDLLPLARRASV